MPLFTGTAVYMLGGLANPPAIISKSPPLHSQLVLFSCGLSCGCGSNAMTSLLLWADVLSFLAHLVVTPCRIVTTSFCHTCRLHELRAVPPLIHVCKPTSTCTQTCHFIIIIASTMRASQTWGSVSMTPTWSRPHSSKKFILTSFCKTCMPFKLRVVSP